MIISTPWETLRALPAWQLSQVPRRSPREDDARDEGTAQRFQALAAAYCRGTPVAVAWLREHPGGPVRVLAAGSALAGGKDGEQVVLTVPAGARGSPLAPDEAAVALLGIPYWTALSGVSDALLTEDTESAGDPPSLEEGLLSAWSEPFAWLLLAEPATGDVLDELTSSAASAQLSAQQTSSPRAQLAVRRAAARHSELRRAAATGLWRVHLLAGGITPEGAAHVAGLVCASADLTGLPYALVPRPGVGPLPAMLSDPAVRQLQHAGNHRRDNGFQLTMRAPAVAARIANAAEDPDTPQPQSPFYASTRLLATIAAPPRREVPGLRFALRPEFDTTPENGLCDTVPLGLTLDRDRRPAGPMALPRSSLNRHVFVCGATGAGKSQTIRGLLEAATAEAIPWLVIEPAKAEYHLMAARLPDAEVIRIRLGELDVPPAGVNPLEPASGPDGSTFPLQVHADLVRSLFLAAFQADEPFPQVLAAALTRCYEQAGWDMVTGTSGAAYPGLPDLQAAAMAVVADGEVAGNAGGFVSVRIGSLRHGTAGRFLDGGHRLDFGELLDRNVVLEIEDAGDDHDKAFLIGIVLIRLVEHLRLRARAEGAAAPRLRHLTVIEEAHRLLRQPSADAGASGRAVEMFADLLAEVRAYGEGLVIAEQIPAKLIPDVIKNTAVKIVHRLPAADDRAVVGATMNLTGAQSDYLVTLTPGEAAVFTDGMDYPLLVRMPDGTVVETTSPAKTAEPGALIGVRSPSCDLSCRAEPCTLRQIRAAQNGLLRDPAITLWAELAVLGALTGWTPPVPGPELTVRLLDLPERLLGCTLSHAVDAAVGARSGLVGDPAALAVHVTGVLRDFVGGGQPYPAPGAEWLAGVCRWNLLVAALASHVRAVGPDGPPVADADVPGETSGEQLAAVRAWKAAAWRRLSDQQHRVLVFGGRVPSAIEEAVGGRAGEREWRSQVVAAMADAFADGDWFLSWLAARAARSARSARPARATAGR